MPKHYNRLQLLAYIEKVKTLPEAYREVIRSWPDVQKSPYSRSFYSDRGKSWQHTPDGCERISDHWNFRGKRRRGPQQTHCRTDRPITNGSRWTHAVYSQSTQTWTVKSSYSKVTGEEIIDSDQAECRPEV